MGLWLLLVGAKVPLGQEGQMEVLVEDAWPWRWMMMRMKLWVVVMLFVGVLVG